MKVKIYEYASGKHQRGQYFPEDARPDFTGREDIYQSPWGYHIEVRDFYAAGADRIEGQRLSDGSYLTAAGMTDAERQFETGFTYHSTGENVVLVATQQHAQDVTRSGRAAIVKRARSLAQFNGRVVIDWLWLDYDDPGDLERARQRALSAVQMLLTAGVAPEHIQVRFSGSKGFHVLFPAGYIGLDLVSDMPVRQLSRRLAVLMPALFPGADSKAYVATQLLRVPNTRHPKTGLFCLPLSVAELNNLTVPQIQALAVASRSGWVVPECPVVSVAPAMREATVLIMDREAAESLAYGHQQVAQAVGGSVSEAQLLAWLDANDWPHTSALPLDAGRKIVRLGRCPLEANHGSPGGDHGAFIIFGDGALVYTCFHAGCTPPIEAKTGRPSHVELTRRAVAAITASHGVDLVCQPRSAPGGTDMTVVTDRLAAELFLDASGRLTLRNHRGVFHFYAGAGYVEIPYGDVENMAMAWLRKNAPRDATASKLKTVVAQLAALGAVPYSRTFGSWLDPECPDGDQLAVANGILDIDGFLRGAPQSECLRPHSPQYFDALARPCAYDPAADCPVFSGVLAQVLPDAESRRVVQEFAGYALTSSCRYQRFMIFTGTGANGKTTVGDVIAGIVGDAHLSSVPVSAFGGHFQLWPLATARLNYVSELPVFDGASSLRLAEEKLKAVVSGDLISVEQKHRDTYKVRPTAKLLFLGNELPPFFDRSNGIWRRLLIVPFKQVIPEAEQRADLAREILRSEGSGVLNWALAGLKRLVERGGFREPPEMSEAKMEHRFACDHEAEFLIEHYRFDPNHGRGELGNADFDSIMRKYRCWCQDNGYCAVGKNRLGEAIRRCFPETTAERRSVQTNPYGPVKKITAYVGVIEDT